MFTDILLLFADSLRRCETFAPLREKPLREKIHFGSQIGTDVHRYSFVV